ncbi:MAG TPA: hypothetical protein VF152_03570 [Acidimicrobiia bacterium]
MNLRRALPRGLAATLVAALALAPACGDDDDSTTGTTGGGGGTIAHPTGADELVFRVDTRGGLVGPSLAAVPQISVYGDGRVIVIGPTTLEYPGAALPNLQQGTLSDAELQALLRAADAAGLLAADPPDYGDPPVTDLPTTEVTVNAAGVQRTVNVYALEFDDADESLEPDQRDARRRLREVLALVDADVATESYRAAAVAVFVEPYDPVAGADADVGPYPWPLGDLAGVGEPVAGFGDARCFVVEGGDARTVLDAAAMAREGGPWTAAGVEYELRFRPLLPNESSCDDLVPAQTGGA